jgi:hypothetical protein
MHQLNLPSSILLLILMSFVSLIFFIGISLLRMVLLIKNYIPYFKDYK